MKLQVKSALHTYLRSCDPDMSSTLTRTNRIRTIQSLMQYMLSDTAVDWKEESMYLAAILDQVTDDTHDYLSNTVSCAKVVHQCFLTPEAMTEDEAISVVARQMVLDYIVYSETPRLYICKDLKIEYNRTSCSPSEFLRYMEAHFVA